MPIRPGGILKRDCKGRRSTISTDLPNRRDPHWESHTYDDRIFTNEVGRPLFPTSITQWMRKFIKRTGPPPACVHSLRHTYASLLIADKTPLVVAAGNLGHAQVSTTNNIYSHVIASSEATAVEVIDKFSEDIHRKFTPKPDKTEVC